ncbi:MAG TPA: glutamyl-tRNA reductase, partial [Trueperaceae bacterium]|nr:glutamyl-tRNA reductase [Trueperaceae bacterium]
GSRVAVLGAGEMGGLAARGLARSDLGLELVIVNRGSQRGRALADAVGGTWLALADFLAEPPAVTGLVAATPRAGLIDRPLLAKLSDLAVVLDLGMPRNVAPGSLDGSHVSLLDIDTLRVAGQRRREAIGARLADAERLVQEELEAALDVWTDRQLAPAIRRLRQLYRDTIGEGLPADQADRLAHRFAHVPVKGLRALARRYGVEAAATFLAETEQVTAAVAPAGRYERP